MVKLSILVLRHAIVTLHKPSIEQDRILQIETPQSKRLFLEIAEIYKDH